MEISSQEAEIIKTEGPSAQQKINEIVRVGKPLLENTALIESTKEIGPKEVEVTRTLLTTIAPITKDNFRIHEHLYLTGKFASKIGEALGLNPYELEVLGLLHDTGRFLTHRYYRHDLLGPLILEKLGIRKGFLEKMPSLKGYVGPKTYHTINDLSLSQKIIDIADFCGKRKEDGNIRTFDEVMSYHRESRKHYETLTGQKRAWPSEKYAHKHMLSSEFDQEGIIERSARIYIDIKKWLEAQGVDVEQTRKEILKDESQIGIKAIIFDVGGVIVPNPDKGTKEDFAKVFKVDFETVDKAWSELIPQLRTGQITQEEFWQKFSKQVEKPLPEGYGKLWLKNFTANLNLEVIKIIKSLKEKGYRLALLSDTIPPHQRIIEKKFKESGLDFWNAEIFSPDIKVAKADPVSPAAFLIANLNLGLPPQACLIIDDKEEYVATARATKMQAIHFNNPKQLKKDLEEKRLL